VSNQNLEKNKPEQILCAGYICTYKDVLNAIPKISEKIKELHMVYKDMNKEDNSEELENIKLEIKHKIKEKNMLISASNELLDIIMHLERYLPYERRFYSRKQAEELSRQTFNKASNVGVMFKENMSIQSVEELVHNKILQDELLYMFKSLLTDKQYTCMYLYYYEKLTQEQIADKLVMSRQNVSAHINNSIELIQRSEYLLSLLEYLV
jgi:RNA polymerase sigma factor (sigma-70 family)